MHRRGGYRPGAGRKGAWRHGETRTIRVPVALADRLLEIGRELDSGNDCAPESLTGLLDEWQMQCDAQPADAPEWQKVRQLLSEIRELLSESAEFAEPGMGRGFGRGRGKGNRPPMDDEFPRGRQGRGRGRYGRSMPLSEVPGDLQE